MKIHFLIFLIMRIYSCSDYYENQDLVIPRDLLYTSPWMHPIPVEEGKKGKLQMGQKTHTLGWDGVDSISPLRYRAVHVRTCSPSLACYPQLPAHHNICVGARS